MAPATEMKGDGPEEDGPATRPRAVFVVSGVFDDAARARAFAREQKGWSCVARLVALTMMADGWPDPAPALPLG